MTGLAGLALALALTALYGEVRPPATHASAPADWPSYVYNVQRGGFNGAETGINPTSAPNLQPLWLANTGAVVSVQPIVANGLIYWGAWDGFERATRPDGTLAWSTNLGTTPTPPACTGRTHGVLGAPTVATETIAGTPRSVAYVAGGSDVFYALDALTGAIIWQDALAAPPSEIWASPAVYNGSVYISVASWGDCPLTQSLVFQLDATTGAIQHTFDVVPSGCIGAGVWGSIAIDPGTGVLFFGTGNPGPCSQSEYNAEAVVELHASDLSYVDSWQVPQSQVISDGDFGSTPTLFPATIAGITHTLVGIANKNGIYYALDEASLSAGPVWEDQIAVGGDSPELGFGSISPSAWDGTTLYIAGGNTTINSQSCLGGLRAADPSTGAFLWQDCLPDGWVLGAVAAVPGVVAVGEGNQLLLAATTDGHTLMKYAAPGSFDGGASIANGAVYAGSADGTLSALATPLPLPPGTILGQDNFQRADQAFWGTASDGHLWAGDANAVNAFSIAGNAGQIVNGSTTLNAVLGLSAADSEVVFTGSLSAFDGTTNMGAVVRWQDTNDWYKAYIDGSALVLQKRAGGAYTLLGSVPFAATAGTPYTLRFRIVGNTLTARVWPAGTAEPATWLATVTDGSFASGFSGLRIQTAGGATAQVTGFLADVPSGSTNTPTSTATNAPTATATNTPTSTATNTPTATSTATPTVTATASDTPAPTATVTPGPPPPPVMLDASSGGTTTTVRGALSAVPATVYTVDVYGDATCDPSGATATLIGSVSVTTDASGNATFTNLFSQLAPAGQVVMGTATDPTSATSAFSGCATVVARQCTDDTTCNGYTDAQKIALGTNPFNYCAIMRADVNGDGIVNGVDLNQMAKYFTETVPPAPTRVDQNADNVINGVDLNGLAQVFTLPVSECP